MSCLNLALQPTTPPPSHLVAVSAAVTCKLIHSTGEKVVFQAPFDSFETKIGVLDEELFIPPSIEHASTYRPFFFPFSFFTSQSWDRPILR